MSRQFCDVRSSPRALPARHMPTALLREVKESREIPLEEELYRRVIDVARWGEGSFIRELLEGFRFSESTRFAVHEHGAGAKQHLALCIERETRASSPLLEFIQVQ